MADDDDDEIGRQIVGAVRREMSPHTEQRLSTFRKARNSLPSPQRGQRPRNPRFKEDQRSRFSTAPVSRVQILLMGLMVSMTWLSSNCRIFPIRLGRLPPRTSAFFACASHV